MQANVVVGGQAVGETVSPINADNSPSTATLSNIVFFSSDVAIFTAAPDPLNPAHVLITGVSANADGSTVSATLTATATATEQDGRSGQIQGVMTVNVSVAPPPPPAPAVALIFTPDSPTA